jgi:hypothetical protein
MLRRPVLVLLLPLLLSGCSWTGLWYDNADWLAQRWAARLIDASDAQRTTWREPFRAAMADHRRDLLPQIIALLQALESEAERGLNAERLGCLLETADGIYREHAALAVALGTLVLSDLSPAQLEHLAEELRERNRDYEEDYLQPDPARRERERIERYVERIERWTGELPAAQLALVEATVRSMPDLAAEWLAYRRQQQRHLLTLLGQSAGPAALQRFLTAWWVELADRPAELVDQGARIRAASVRLALELDAAFSAEQRAGFRDRVRELRQDLGRAAPGPVPVQLSQALLAGCAAGI